MLIFVNDYSRYVVAYFMKHKSEVATKMNEFKVLHEIKGDKD